MNKSVSITKQKKQISSLPRSFKALWREVRYAIKYIRQAPVPSYFNLDYNQYWQVRGLHTVQPRYHIIADIIKSNSTVLDIGCGEGLLLEYLTQTRQIRGHGIDVSATALKMAKNRNVQVFVADIRNWKVQGVYDYIILSEVIEHLANSELVIEELRKHFSQGLIVTVPNIGYYPHRLRLLLGQFPVQWGWHPAEHLRYWTVVDFIRWVQQFGLRVTEVYSSNGFPLLHKYWPNLFGNQIVFLLEETKNK